jgi:hypothetical protein
MSNYNYVISDSLEYYDKNNEIYKSFIDKIRFVKFIKHYAKPYEIELYDDNKILLLKSTYELLGLYHNSSKIWTWAWAIPTLEKYQTNLSRQIFNYGIDLDPTEDVLLKTHFITSKFIINNEIQLDIHAAIASYISKQKLIFQFRQSLKFWEQNYIYEKGKGELKDDNYIDILKSYDETDNLTEFNVYYLCLFGYENIKL